MISISISGSLLSLMCNGFIIPLIGPKRCLLMTAIPITFFWLLIHFATNFNYILWARFLNGWSSSSIYLTLILYSAEVANDEWVYNTIGFHFMLRKLKFQLFFYFASIRGRLTSFVLLSMNVGLLIAYVLGAYVQYEYIPYICVTIPIIFAVSFSMLPNTPRYHLAAGNIQVRQFCKQSVFFFSANRKNVDLKKIH